jgi:hypothetical protein
VVQGTVDDTAPERRPIRDFEKCAVVRATSVQGLASVARAAILVSLMAQPVRYKRPRRINPVSVTVVLLLALAGYLTAAYLPPYLQQHEVYRVLEEHGSKVANRSAYYREHPENLEQLRRQMESEIRRIGVTDPELETWVEIDQHEMRFGAIYTETITWALDLFSPHLVEYEVEHVVGSTR